MANSAATIDARLKEAIPLYEKLKSEWNRKPPNVAKTDEIVASLKVTFHVLFSFENNSSFIAYLEFIC